MIESQEVNMGQQTATDSPHVSIQESAQSPFQQASYKALQQQQLNVAAKPRSSQKRLAQKRHSSLANSVARGSISRDQTLEGRMSSCNLDAGQ